MNQPASSGRRRRRHTTLHCDTIKFGGYQTVASSGVDALSQLAQECVDMVISDVQMDHMDGRELLRQVR